MARLEHLKLIVVVMAVALATLACSTERNNKRRIGEVRQALETPTSDDLIEKGGSGAPIEAGAAGYSEKAHVRFKKQHLLRADLEQSLGLAAGEICKEFGELDCIDEVHKLALGGVDAYHKSIFVGIEESMPTTPIVLERIVLSGCRQRVREDFAGSANGLIFQGLSLETDGSMAMSARDKLQESVRLLYRRALHRDPSTEEEQALVSMYDEVESKVARDAASTWATLACYAVHTSAEFAFY